MDKIKKTLQLFKDSWKSFSKKQKYQMVGVLALVLALPTILGGIYTVKLFRSGATTPPVTPPTPSPTPIASYPPTPTPAPSITVYSSPQADTNGNVIIPKGQKIVVTGILKNLSGTLNKDYTRAFIFDPIFNNSCSNTNWVITCTAKQGGIGRIYIEVYKGNLTYRSNIIKVTVTAPKPTIRPSPVPIPKPTIRPTPKPCRFAIFGRCRLWW